jgi:hypothetical protein
MSPADDAREGVEIAGFLLALARNFGLLFHRVREMARHHRDHHEQQQIEDLVRTREIEAVVGREEEISRPQHTGHGRNQRRHQAEVPAGEQHRQEVDDGAAADVEGLNQHVGNQRRRSDHHQGDGAAAQFAANGVHSDQRSSRSSLLGRHPDKEYYVGPARSPLADPAG